MKIKAGFICAALLCAPVAAQANEPRLVGQFGDWTAYSRFDGAQQICYALATPRSKAPSNVRHGDVYFMVANWKSGAATEQPSLLAGFDMKTNIPPAARVGSTKIPMYVAQNEAFVEESSDEKRLVRSMRAGSTMQVNATSTRGTSVSYNFSLKGITAALQKARAACS